MDGHDLSYGNDNRCNTLGFRLRLRHHASQMQQYSLYFVSFLDDLHLADRVTFVCVYVCTYLIIIIIHIQYGILLQLLQKVNFFMYVYRHIIYICGSTSLSLIPLFLYESESIVDVVT